MKMKFALCFSALISLNIAPCQAQDMEPRRWSHLPIGTHFLGGGVVRTDADIVLDPVILAEDVEMEMDTTLLKYIYSFELFNKSALVSIAQAHHNATWSGLLAGIPTSIQRVGLSDTAVRFAIYLKGAPPLSGKDYLSYRSNQDIETLVGLGVVLDLPTGEYMDDKLINLGANRVRARIQLGAVHKRHNLSFEATGGVWLHADNDDFFNGNRLEQDPLYVFQTHVIGQLRRGWVGVSAGAAYGGKTTIASVEKDDVKKDLFWAVSYGLPLAKRLNVKIAYIGRRTEASTGIDSDSLAVAFSTFW